MRKPIISCLFLLFFFSSIAQNEANNWIFGYSNGIDFSSGKPIFKNQATYKSFEGGSSISDSSGQLLLYSNGMTIWDKNQKILAKSDSSKSWGNYNGQRCLIVTQPSADHLIYLFSIHYNLDIDIPNYLVYTIIDVSKNSGNGEIVFYDTLERNVLEKIAAVSGNNEQSIWITGRRYDNNEFYSYKLTANGLSKVPVVSKIGNQINFVPNKHHRSAFKASPNGQLIGFVDYHNLKVCLYEFDKLSGSYSNEILIKYDSSDQPYGLEFSPNSKLLYVSTEAKNILQYQLANYTPKNINNSKTIVGTSSGHHAGALQLGPDLKIYHAQYNQNFLGVIINPNSIGENCEFDPHGFSLNENYSLWGLPSFPSYYFEQKLDECKLLVPSAFSPNNDGINDTFQIHSSCDKTLEYSLNIYNRWGEKIYERFSNHQGWKGSNEGEKYSEGNYIYTIKYHFGDQKIKLTSGTIYLMR